jgi:hypothetical protein
MTGMSGGVKPTDPAVFVVMTVLFFAIAALAAWVPTQWAVDALPAGPIRPRCFPAIA